MNELSVKGYHLFNFLVHLLTSILIYFFVINTFNTPHLKNSHLKQYDKIISCFSALIFSVHPIQTQAVTYIIQRFSSLATFFYLLSIVFYIKWRLIQEDPIPKSNKLKTSFFYLLCLLSIIMAMKTKEIAFTLPIIIILYEFFFFEGNIKKRILNLLPIILTILIIPLSLIKFSKSGTIAVSDFSEITRLETEISRWDYLLTQFRVIVTYIRLMLFPVNQNLDYDYPLYRSFFCPEVLLSFFFLLLIFSFSIFLLIRYRKKTPHTLLISFGIFWFFITLSVESSIIPILDLIYEHRLYLPSIGFIISFCVSFFSIANLYKRKASVKNLAIVILIIFCIILTVLTYKRNQIWSSNISLWEDVVKKSPNKTRPHYNLGTVYMEKYFNEKSEILLNKAIEEFKIALKLNPKHAGAYNNLGNAYIFKGVLDKAIESYKNSLKINPNNIDAIGNMGNIYLYQGLIDKAIECYSTVIKAKPNNINAHFNLALAYLKKKETNKALDEFQNVLKLNPEMKEARDYINQILKN